MSDPNDDTEPGSFAWARKHRDSAGENQEQVAE